MTPPSGGAADDGEDARRAEERRGQSPTPVFLERRSYRRRRLMDASKLLPVLGAALLLVPLLWLVGGEAAAPVPTSQVVIYIFAVWALLIGINALFGAAVRRWADDWTRTDPARTAEAEEDRS